MLPSCYPPPPPPGGKVNLVVILPHDLGSRLPAVLASPYRPQYGLCADALHVRASSTFTRIHLDSLQSSLSQPYTIWWHTTPVTTKVRHHGAGGANTHSRPAPTTSEDEGCRLSLHCLRTSSRHSQPHFELARVDLSFLFRCLCTFQTARVLVGPRSLVFPFGFLSGPFLPGPT